MRWTTSDTDDMRAGREVRFPEIPAQDVFHPRASGTGIPPSAGPSDPWRCGMLTMSRVRTGTLGFLLVVLSVGSVGAQEGTAIQVSGMAGLLNPPDGFDVFRSVDYGLGRMGGGGLAVNLFPMISVRGDFAYARSSGQEGGVVDEAVTLDRSYYSVSLEFRRPTRAGVSPFGFVGGGLVNLRRSAPSYNFDLTEGGALVGGGVAWVFPDSPLGVFAQVSQWLYSRTSAGGTQYDTSFGLGLSYRIRM